MMIFIGFLSHEKKKVLYISIIKIGIQERIKIVKQEVALNAKFIVMC